MARNRFEPPPARVRSAEDFHAPSSDSLDILEVSREEALERMRRVIPVRAFGVRDDVADAFDKVSSYLTEGIAEEAEPFGSTLDLDDPVVGVGMGVVPGSGSEGVYGSPGGVGEECLLTYVSSPMAEPALRERLAAAAGADALKETTLPLRIVVSGVVEAFSPTYRSRLRPAPAGVSVGHRLGADAGTLGAFCVGRTAPTDRRLMILSNNHVIVNDNIGEAGESVLQPAPVDGGSAPQDELGILERYVPLDWTPGTENYVDAATAWVDPGSVDRRLMFLGGEGVELLPFSPEPMDPVQQLRVAKCGRTTHYTEGTIESVETTVRVRYRGGRIATFKDQISVRRAGSVFSSGGDSGSLVWRIGPERNPVGMVFAGGSVNGGATFLNPMGYILAALDIELVA